MAGIGDLLWRRYIIVEMVRHDSVVEAGGADGQAMTELTEASCSHGGAVSVHGVLFGGQWPCTHYIIDVHLRQRTRTVKASSIWDFGSANLFQQLIYVTRVALVLGSVDYSRRPSKVRIMDVHIIFVLVSSCSTWITIALFFSSFFSA